MAEENKNEVEIIRKSLNIYPIYDRIYVVAFAFNKEDVTQNRTKQIKARRGTAIGGYPYDMKADCYHIECVESYELGFIDSAYRLSLDNVGPWTIMIPLPSELIRIKLDKEQKAHLSEFESKYSNKKFEIHFAQLSSCDH